MEVFLAVLQLLAGLFGAMKAYFEYRRNDGSGEGDDDHPDTHDSDHRPKHLRG